MCNTTPNALALQLAAPYRPDLEPTVTASSAAPWACSGGPTQRLPTGQAPVTRSGGPLALEQLALAGRHPLVSLGKLEIRACRCPDKRTVSLERLALNTPPKLAWSAAQMALDV